MTNEFTADEEISSTEEFESALGDLLLVARRNDVDPRGSWEYRTDGPASNVEVVVVELAD